MNVLVVAPHADDETLGCGGAILKHKENGDTVHWLLVTNIKEKYGFDARKEAERQEEINYINKFFGFNGFVDLGLEPAKLDVIPKQEIISIFHDIFSRIQPNLIYLPFKHDAHSDHGVVFDAVLAASKTFRTKTVAELLCYEVLSETNFSSGLASENFVPNVFINIDSYIDNKLKALLVYSSEIKNHPFPRSVDAVKSLAILRGSQANCEAAEAFYLLKSIR